MQIKVIFLQKKIPLHSRATGSKDTYNHMKSLYDFFHSRMRKRMFLFIAFTIFIKNHCKGTAFF